MTIQSVQTKSDAGPHKRPGGDLAGLKLQARGLSREIAAIYIGVGSTKFDQMVLDGRMPNAKRVDGRRVWDKHLIDLAFDSLPNELEALSTDTWSDL
jgi:hypothetical protein